MNTHEKYDTMKTVGDTIFLLGIPLAIWSQILAVVVGVLSIIWWMWRSYETIATSNSEFCAWLRKKLHIKKAAKSETSED